MTESPFVAEQRRQCVTASTGAVSEIGKKLAAPLNICIGVFKICSASWISGRRGRNNGCLPREPGLILFGRLSMFGSRFFGRCTQCSAHFILHRVVWLATLARAGTHRLTGICRCRHASLLLALDIFNGFCTGHRFFARARLYYRPAVSARRC